MRVNCRCSSCGARKSLERKPDRYIRPPKCPVCGKRRWRVDKYRMLVEKRVAPCRCGGYWFLHRKGSKWCLHNPKSEEIFQARRRVA